MNRLRGRTNNQMTSQKTAGLRAAGLRTTSLRTTSYETAAQDSLIVSFIGTAGSAAMSAFEYAIRAVWTIAS